MQPIDEANPDTPQEQVKNFALNTGIIPNANLDLNSPVLRGEFFTYITRAQNYKEAHAEVIDGNLPGCVPFVEVKLQDISAKIPKNMIKVPEDPEVLYEDYYDNADTKARISFGIYESG